MKRLFLLAACGALALTTGCERHSADDLNHLPGPHESHGPAPTEAPHAEPALAPTAAPESAPTPDASKPAPKYFDN